MIPPLDPDFVLSHLSPTARAEIEPLLATLPKDDRGEEYRRTGTIYSSLVTQSVIVRERLHGGEDALNRLRNEEIVSMVRDLDVFRAVCAVYDRIVEAIVVFQSEVWVPTVGPYYAAATKRGHSGRGGSSAHDPFRALLWGSAGRVLLTLRDEKNVGEGSKYDGAWVTLIFAEDEPTLKGGLQGLCARESEVSALLRAAVEAFPTLSPDPNVSFI